MQKKEKIHLASMYANNKLKVLKCRNISCKNYDKYSSTNCILPNEDCKNCINRI